MNYPINIEKILSDEVWLEGERRGQPVEVYDPLVLQNSLNALISITTAETARILDGELQLLGNDR